jgi:hypothetical protein
LIEGRAFGGGGGDGANEIRYENKAGLEEMFVHASGDMSVLVQNAKSEDIKSNSLRAVAVDHSLEVGGNYDETIGASQYIVIGGNDTETVGQARDKSVGKDESSTVGGSRQLAVKGSNETSAVGTRDLAVGVAQIDISLGDIQLKTATLKQFVGVAVVRITPKDITESVGAKNITASTVAGALGAKGLLATAASAVKFNVNVGGVVQTIGGAKIELTPLERTIATTKSYTELVGGMMTLKAGETFKDLAKELAIVGRASMSVHSKTTLNFVAEERIDIECGSSKLMITKDEVRISGPSLNLSGTTVSAKGKKIHHNV